MTQHTELGSPAGGLVLASRTDYEVKLSGPSPNPGGSLFIECGEGVLVGFDPIDVGTITEMTIHWPTAGRGVIDGLMGDGAYQFILNGDSAQIRDPDPASAEIRHLAGALAFAEHFRRLPGCADRQDLWHLDVTVLADRLVELGFEFEAVAAASAPLAAELLIDHYRGNQVNEPDGPVVTKLMPAVARHLDPYSDDWQWLDDILSVIRGEVEPLQLVLEGAYRGGRPGDLREAAPTIDLQSLASVVIPAAAIGKLDREWAIIGAKLTLVGGELGVHVPAKLPEDAQPDPIFAIILSVDSEEILEALTLSAGLDRFSGEVPLPRGLELSEIDVWITDRLQRPIPPPAERARQRGQALAKLARHAALSGHTDRASQLYGRSAKLLRQAGDHLGAQRAEKLAQEAGPSGPQLYRYRGLPRSAAPNSGPTSRGLS